MSGKKRFKAPTYNEAFFMKLIEQNFKNLGPLRGHNCSPNGDFDFDRHGGKALWSYYGIKQILAFADRKIVPCPGDYDRVSYSFLVLTPLNYFKEYKENNNPAEIERAVSDVKSALDHRINDSLPDRYKTILKKMFEKPKVEAGAIEFRGTNYNGIMSSLKIKQIPRTKNGKLSIAEFDGKIIPCLFESLIFPTMRAAMQNPEIEKGVTIYT